MTLARESCQPPARNDHGSRTQQFHVTATCRRLRSRRQQLLPGTRTQERCRRLGAAGRPRRRLRDFRRLRRLELRPGARRLGRVVHRHTADGDHVFVHVLLPRRAVIDGAHGRRRLRLRPHGVRPAGRLSHRHGDPHRIRHRASGHRGVHRRLLRIAVRYRRLDGLPRLLHRLHRHPHLRRRRGAQADVHHHRRRRAGARRVHRGDGAALLGGQSDGHCTHHGSGCQRLSAVRLRRHLGGDSLCHLVLPRRRRRAAGRRGNQESAA